MAKHWWTRVVVGRTSVSDPLQEHEPPDARFEAEWRPKVKARLLLMLAVLAVWAVGVEARLIYLQVYAHHEYAARAGRQQADELIIETPRGDISDRNGHLLASSVQSMDVFAKPQLMTAKETPAGLAREICAAFGDCSPEDLSQITTRLADKGKGKGKQVPIRTARFMSSDAANGLKAWMAARAKKKLPPVLFVVHRDHRYFPKMELASHVVGYLLSTGIGAAGVEARYEADVSGKPGKILVYKDGHDNELFTRVESQPVAGASLELTIDIGLQNIVEQALREGLAASGATSGTAIILGVETGEILAMKSYPDYNPNNPGMSAMENHRNRAVQDLYEPGSTFKIVSGSAALNEGIFKPSTMIDASQGFIKFPGRKPITENEKHNYGVLSFSDALIRSSNVAAVKMGLQVGADRMRKYVAAFGFGQQIAPDFAGERTGGIGLDRGRLDDSGLASVSMGYQVSVTPIQMASAANVVASGGLLLEPHVVRARVWNGWREEIQPKVLRRVITPETALAMTAIMEGVVGESHGTGKLAALDRYQVAGKTGTAKKIVGGQYSNSDFFTSFVGFVPSRRPVFTILVMVDTPTIGRKYGGTVAAPIFKKIAEAALQYAGVPASINPEPPIIVPTERRILPADPTRVSTPVVPVTDAGGRLVMPDLGGLSIREALRVTNKLELRMSYVGDGVVVSQTPAPGTAIQSSDRGVLQLRRSPVKPGGGNR